ncbi:MAG: pitrilysin family protein [Vulcanimicrobiaceae bacterium]
MLPSFTRFGAIIGFVVAALAPAGAAPAPSVVPSAAAPSDVTRATLANGLRVVIVRDPLAPVVSVYENYLVGANETPPEFPGMAHAQEHMAFRGCSGVSGDQISAIFAQLGGEGNADTQQTITQYFATIPAADLDVELQVDSACMRDIADSQSEWASERGAIEQEVAADLSNPSYKALGRLTRDLFAGTPYAHDALGTRESFRKTTGADLKAFYKAWYAPNNAVLVIAGDVEPKATLALISKLYGTIPSRPIAARPTVSLQPVRSESFDVESDLPYSLVFIGYRLPGSGDPDFAAARILADVLASQRGELFALAARGKALQAGAQLSSTYPKASLALVYGALPVGADVKAFDATLAGVVASYAKSGVPAELVEAAKHAEIASNEYARNSISELAGAWSQAIADEGRTSPDDDVAALAKVTVADVDRVAKTYLVPSGAVTANLVPKASGKASASKGFGGGETLTSAPTKPVVLPEWARTKLARLEVAPSRIAPVDATLPNGIRLIVQPETASDTVTVIGEIRHDDSLQTPPGKDGVGGVLGGLFAYGTTSLDRLAYQKALDDIAAQESAGPSFSLHVLKADFDRGVALLADNELHPALPADAFAIVRKQNADETAGELHSPSYLAGRELARALLPPGDPQLREATPQSISALSLEDAKAYHASVYRPDMTTIVVSGNVTPAEARATIAKYFGGWHAKGPMPTIDLAPVPANPIAALAVPDESRVQDETQLVETVALTRKDPAYYALVLGDHVLGGGFYATRLYHDIRQVAGLVYNVSNHLSAGRTRTTYSVSYGSDPQNVSKARALVARDLRAMQTTDVSPSELLQAKAILLRQIPLGEASVDGVASALASRSIAGLPLDEAHRAAVIYASLTAADVRAAFAKYIRPDGFVQVVQGPAPQ